MRHREKESAPTDSKGFQNQNQNVYFSQQYHLNPIAVSSNIFAPVSDMYLSLKNNLEPVFLFLLILLAPYSLCLSSYHPVHSAMASSSPLSGSSATSTIARLSLSAADMLTMMLVVLQLKPFRYLQLLTSCMAVLTKINANHAHSPQVGLLHR